MTTAPTIQDKAPKPAGLLPKNVQSWLLVGLAVLMVLIMWLTGGKKPPVPAKGAPPAPAVLPPLEVNEAKIIEMQKRIEDLQREQAVAQNALAQQVRTLPRVDSVGQTQPGQPQTYGNPPEKPEDAIQAERKKRDYLSLFASNVALSYRKASVAHEENAPVAQSTADLNATQLAELLKPLQLPSPSLPSAQPPKPSAEEGRKEESHPIAPPAVSAAATGKTYVLFEGTVLETALINRLDGQFTGPVECLLTNDVFSHDRQHLLIPSGTKLLGETRKVEAFGQTRLAVIFHRLVMPDGFSGSLDRFQGLNQIGDAGLRDQVNNHYLRIFGTSLALGAIGAVAEAGTSGALTASGGDLMRQGFAQSTAQSSAQILDKFLNVLPTITIREGHRVKVYLSGDLALPDYTNHTMPSNL
ncbi:MAG TPA: TrbI/VirB10 family protein [Terriglobales bacterium]|nr:TrbI/VirB10 family protein [Terriglobales bacterium]